MIVASYLALFLSALPGERATIDVAALVNQAEECSPKSYGGHTFAMCDVAPAMERAVILCKSQLSVYDAAEMPCNYNLPLGLWFWSKRVEICAGRLDGHGSRIRTGFITPVSFPGFGACGASGWPAFNTQTAIVDLEFEPLGTLPITTIAYGLEIAKPTIVDRVKVSRYTQGVRVVAWASNPVATGRANANGCKFSNLYVAESLHNGMFFDGPDANACLIEQSSITRSCNRGASLVPSMGACADVLDASFLGNTFVGVKTGYAQDHYGCAIKPPATSLPSHCESVPAGPKYPGFVLGQDANSRALCIGCYAESGYEDSTVGESANAIGGIAPWSGPGGVLQGSKMNTLEIANGEGTAKVSFGLKATGAGTAMMLTPIGFATATQPLRFKMTAATNSMLLDVGNLGTAQVLRIGMNASAVGGIGGLYLRPNSTLPPVYLNTTLRIVQEKPAP